MKNQSDIVTRSSFVNWIAWVGITHAGLFLILLLQFGLLAMVVSFTQVQAIFSRTQIAPGNLYCLNWLFAHIQFVLCSLFVLTLFSLIVSIALLWRKSWARVTFIWIMVLGIVLCLFPLFTPFSSLVDSFLLSSQIQDLQMIVYKTLHMLWMVLILCSVLTAFLFAWVIKKLLSPEIRAEF